MKVYKTYWKYHVNEDEFTRVARLVNKKDYHNEWLVDTDDC